MLSGDIEGDPPHEADTGRIVYTFRRIKLVNIFVDIYSPWDQPQGLSRGYFFVSSAKKKGWTYAV